MFRNIVLSILFGVFTLVFVPNVFAASNADLVVPSFQLTDSRGNAKTTFKPNEDIFIRFSIKNQGFETAYNKYTSSGHIWSQVYGHKPSAVSTAVETDIGVWIRNNNNIKPGQSYNYQSYSGGTNQWAFEGAKSFKKSSSGTYTARVFVNFDRIAEESNYSNNQKTLTYTIQSSIPKPTPTPAPTNAHAVCDGRNMTINFGKAPEGTVRWAIRIDDPLNPWNGTTPNQGDTLINNHTGSSYNRSINGGQWYFWWIHPLSSTSSALGTSSGNVYCTIGKPTNLRAERSGNTITLRWDVFPSATRYALRINDTSNGWNANAPLTNDRILNDVSGTSYQFTAPSGKRYTWWIHAIDRNGHYSDAVVGEF